MIEVTEENIANYSIEDVILPIIGHKVKMPTNPVMKKIIEDIMKEDDMSMVQFNSHAGLVSTCAAGSYRKMI
jgi:tRNA(Glu) U13 pseudouridine synthase TruD